MQAIPPYVYGLGYLEELSACRNQIVELPPEVSLLRALRRLDLEGNLLKRLPLELCLCPLEHLNLAVPPAPRARPSGWAGVLRKGRDASS